MEKEEKPLLEFEEDSLRGELFYFADIPDEWHDGDNIEELDQSDILDALIETADFVDEDVFEDGMPGMSGAYYKVYASDADSFKTKLTSSLLELLESKFGELK